MKKILKIFFINIFIIFFILLLADWILIAKETYNPYWLYLFPREENPLPFDKTKKSIITAGCSFTYGTNIELEDTFAYKLQNLTNRKVYNKGQGGYGPQQILWQIQNDDFFNNNEIVEPEYYIYTFISDHVRRMYTHYFANRLSERYVTNLYKIKDGKFIPRKQDVIKFSDYIAITKVAKTLNFAMYKYFISDDKKFDLLKLYLHEIRKELNKRYPNIKFVIIIYNLDCDTYQNNHSLPFKTDRWKELEDEGFIIIHFDTPEFDYLNTDDYLTFDNVHPSGKAWDSLAPIIAEKLKL